MHRKHEGLPQLQFAEIDSPVTDDPLADSSTVAVSGRPCPHAGRIIRWVGCSSPPRASTASPPMLTSTLQPHYCKTYLQIFDVDLPCSIPSNSIYPGLSLAHGVGIPLVSGVIIGGPCCSWRLPSMSHYSLYPISTPYTPLPPLCYSVYANVAMKASHATCMPPPLLLLHPHPFSLQCLGFDLFFPHRT